MSQQSIGSSYRISSPRLPYYKTATRSLTQPSGPCPSMASIHPRASPTLGIPLSSHRQTTHYETTTTPSGNEKYMLTPSSPPSPIPSMSVNSTPIIPPSGVIPQRNPFPSSPPVSNSTTAGSKRTASGTLKPVQASSISVPSSPVFPGTPSRRERSQTTSIDTSPRNVSHLSSQLKTRLTYALLKVQNNWISESLDQVEARISQGQHPTSPLSCVKIKRECSVGDESGYDFIRRHHRTASEPSTAHPPSQSHQSGGSGGSGGRTYESFWREHEPNPITKKILQARAASQALGSTTNRYVLSSPAQASSLGGLQPPAQIVPDRDRDPDRGHRSYYNPPRQPPALRHAVSSQSTSSISTIPNSPPSANTLDTQRTMEQDAVESLMSLSFPGHSRPTSGQPNLSQPQIRAISTMVADDLSSPQPESYNYGRSAVTWPRSKRAVKQARTSLGSLRTMDSGVGFDDELTEDENGGDFSHAPVNGQQKEDILGRRSINDGTVTADDKIS